MHNACHACMTELTSSQLVASCMEMDEALKAVQVCSEDLGGPAKVFALYIGDVDICVWKSPLIGLFLGRKSV